MTRPPSDGPAGDAWVKAETAPAPSLDPWGRPLPGTDPQADRAALARTSARLHSGLAGLMGLFVLGGVASALTLVLGVRAALRVLADLGAGLQEPAGTPWMLGLAAVLVLALTGLYVAVIGWARELIGRLSAWALGSGLASAPDAVRIEQLRRTLAGWLSFGQWGSVVGVLLGTALVPLTLQWTQTLATRFDPDAAAGFTDLGPGFVAVQTLSSLVSSAPAVVILWLILGAVRHFMNMAVGRARGPATAPVTPAARLVANWFLLCLILLGLQLLNLLAVTVGIAVLGSLAQQNLALELGLPAQWSGWIGTAAVVLGGLVLYSALVVGLYFALLLWSRSYALALARLLDGEPARPTPAPTTGSAGEHPNIYRDRL